MMAKREGTGLLSRFEHALGLPELSQMRDTLKEVNALLTALDEKRLGTVRHVVDSLLKLQREGGVEGLRTFSQVVGVVAQLEPEKLDKIVGITTDVRATADTVHRILKMLPPDMLKGNEIVDQIKKAMTEGK